MAGSLHDALIGQGVDPDDLRAVMSWAPYQGLGLAERVYRAGLVSDARLVDAFVSLGATDATNLVLAGTPPPAALGAFNRALAERHRALPLAVERRRLVVALLDPSDTATLERLSFTCGLVIEPRACRARVLFEGLARAYERMLTPRELARAQGFPDTYSLEATCHGDSITKTAQTRMVGNSVCPPVAQALVTANLTEAQLVSAAA